MLGREQPRVHALCTSGTKGHVEVTCRVGCERDLSPGFKKDTLVQRQGSDKMLEDQLYVWSTCISH